MLQNFVLLVSGSFKYLMCSERLLLCRCTQQFSCVYFTDRLRPCALEFSIELSLIPHTFDPQLIHIRPWCLVSEPTLTITEQWSWVLFCYRRKGVTPCAVMLLIPILLLCQIMLILKKKQKLKGHRSSWAKPQSSMLHNKKKLTTNWGFDPTTILVFRGSTNRWVLSAFTLQIHRGDQMACARGLM